MSTATATQQAPATAGEQKVRDELVAAQEALRIARLDADITFGPEGMQCKNMAALWRLANMYAKSRLVPQQFQGKPEDCCIALQMAMRLRVDPFMFMQACYVVHGRPGVESKLAIALANNAGAFRDRIKFKLEGTGPNRTCTAFAHDADTGERCEQTVSMAMAKAEGWISKQGSKWQTMPDLMLQYRSAMFLIRLHCPEVLMGMQTVEELADVGGSASPTGRQSASVAELTERLLGSTNGNGHHETFASDDTANDTPQQDESQATDETQDAEDGCELVPEFDIGEVGLRLCVASDLEAVTRIYDEFCGPESIYGEEERDQVSKLVNERRAALNQKPAKANGKGGQREAFDRSPSAVGM